MNRADLQMVLGQADNLGDTLLRNRVMDSQKQQHAADALRQQTQFDATMNLNRDQMKERTGALKLQNTMRQLSNLKKDMQDGMKDLADQARARGADGNAWASEQFKGMLESLPPEMRDEMVKNPNFKTVLSPDFNWLAHHDQKPAGTFNTAPGHNLEVLTQLRKDVATATTPEAKAQADQKLNDFLALTGKGGGDEGIETTETTFPEVPAQAAVPGKPAKSSWFGKDTPAVPEQPAVPGQPARKVTTKRKLGDVATPEAPAAGIAPVAQGEWVQPQDPDDSDMQGRPTEPKSRVDTLIREAQKAIQMGADPAKVIKEAKEKYGITLTIK